MFDQIISANFPETAEWFERYIQEDLDDNDPGFAPAVEFKFRVNSDSDFISEPIPGLKINRNKSYKIETKPGLNFKVGDEIRFYKNDNSIYKITDTEVVIDSRNNEDYILKSLTWPGFLKETKILIITLE